MRIDGCAEILDDQVPVGSGGNPQVAVSHQPLDAVRVDTLAQKLGGEGVPQVVEAHLHVDCLRPKQAPAQLRSGISSAVRSLHARWTVPRQVVGCMHRVFAPAAAVLVAFDDTRPSQGVSQNLLRVRFALALGAVRRREEQRPGRMLELVLNPRPQRNWKWKDGGVSALRRIPVVRARDGESAAGEVDIGLAQSKQLAFAQPQRRPAGEKWSPGLGNLL